MSFSDFPDLCNIYDVDNFTIHLCKAEFFEYLKIEEVLSIKILAGSDVLCALRIQAVRRRFKIVEINHAGHKIFVEDS